MRVLMTRKSCAVGMRNAILRNYLKLVSVVSFLVVSVVSFRSFRWFRFGRSVSLFWVLVHAPENRHFFSKTSCIFMLLGNLFTG